ncbi:MAG: hypothetical protein QXT88_04235 [Desulfurococcaceae archaeon]
MSGKIYGVILMLIAVILALVYIVGLIISPDAPVYGHLTLSEVLIRYTILAIILIISGILGYLGYLVSTSPVPKAIEELVKEYKEQTK